MMADTSGADRTEILIIGAGVSGLTVGVHLAELGYQIRIWTAQPSGQTTSVAAGAMWGPYLVEPLDKVARWSTDTLTELRRLALIKGTGVRLVAGLEASRHSSDPPEWISQLDAYPASEDDLPPDFSEGWRYTAPIVDMPVYLRYLETRLAGAGGSVELRIAERLNGLAPVVINCAGIGAATLVPDPKLTPIRGQLVVLSNPGIDEFFTEETGASPDLLHIYPQGSSVVIGGIATPGDWRLEPDQTTAQAILERCAAVEPRLVGQQILGHRVGLRPTRHEVRVEATKLADGSLVIHNYGHGGAGVSLSWGCAREVARLVASASSDTAMNFGPTPRRRRG